MKKYKNIVFDIGGVLLSYRWLEFVKETIPDDAEAREFSRKLFNDPLWLEFDIEERPFDDVVEDYVKKYPEHESQLRYYFSHLERMPLPRERVWERVRKLKGAGYRMYLLSNYSSRMYHAHTDGLEFPALMDGHIISYEVHHIKPDNKIYEALFERYDLDPSESFFFDDRQENVDAARALGMDGRVVYSEDSMIGYLDRLLAEAGISNKFHDSSLPREARIEWLLSEMNKEEKIILYSHPERGVGRLGVEGFVLGGEAAHGVEARNDQNGITGTDVTTSFPNPIGMSSSWDPDLIYEAGKVVGTEARACWRKHRKTGLSRWAPTIDMERDPRWGRNEEGYGEDPYLTAQNSAAYIRGMQGDDPQYVRCGATLKHYYANNREFNRFISNASVGLRDKYEYYLPPFRTAIQDAGALGVMTAYNKINGVPGMTDPEVLSLLKGKYGLLHAVCDGFAMARLKDFHHEYGTLAECMAESIRAGVDSMSDKPEDVELAVRDALELEAISESELDGALRNILMVGMKLGIYDPDERNPYGAISAGDKDTEEARKICRRLSEESIVLLENKNQTLPLSKDKTDDVALIGPLADESFKDWYMGETPFSHTVRDGLNTLLGKEVHFATGLDVYKIVMDGKAWHIDEDGYLTMSSVEEGSLLHIEDWGEGYHTIRSVDTSKYVQAVFYDVSDDEKELLKADKDDVFDWFVTCRFHISENKDGSVNIRDRFEKPIGITKDGRLKAGDEFQDKNTGFSLIKVSDGMEQAMKSCEDKGTVILVLGCNPLIPAREDFDRTSLVLPSDQQRLLDAFMKSGKKVVTVLLANYPYTMNGAEKKVDALMLSATGSEYMGDAVASALFGKSEVGGRLAQGWPLSEDMLPDMNDYRIIGNRTYRYVDKGWMYPFGYGLNYGDIQYSDMKAMVDGDNIKVELHLENKGSHKADEVVQIYATADFKDTKLTDAGYGRRLVGYKRLSGIKPGASMDVALEIDMSDLQIYDVVAGEYFIYGGIYHLYTGHDALHEAVSIDVQVNGRHFNDRDLARLTSVYACDDYDGAEFTKGHFGMTAATPMNPSNGGPVREKTAGTAHIEGKGYCPDSAELIFHQSVMPDEASEAVCILQTKSEGSMELDWNGKTIATWKGSTSHADKPMTIYELPSEYTVMPETWDATLSEVALPLDKGNATSGVGTLSIRLKGDVKLLSVKIPKHSRNVRLV